MKSENGRHAHADKAARTHPYWDIIAGRLVTKSREPEWRSPTQFRGADVFMEIARLETPPSVMGAAGDSTDARESVSAPHNKSSIPPLIHEAFELQAKLAPYATALTYGDENVTFIELNRLANRVAHMLLRSGIRRGDRVGLYFNRSVPMIAAMLGVLKVGAAYVPLDPLYPEERLRVMVLEASVSAILLSRLGTKRQLLASSQPIYIDDVLALSGEDHNPNCHVTPNDAAYVMFTSGSTGIPNGVEIPHRGVTHLVCGAEYALLRSDCVVLHHSPISFDASTFEVWGALLNGGRCVLAPGVARTAAELGWILAREGVTVLWLTTALFNVLIDEAPDIFSGLRQLLIGGEALSITHVKRALASLTSTQLINAYGPTEATTFSCTYLINSVASDATSIPIGKGIQDAQVLILDTSGEPVSLGTPGEIYVGGKGLALGYLNRPELTKVRFVADPFNPDKRIYRTGDQGRYLPDGNIEFLGRLDNQVKIRGFRVELGEIEMALSNHPFVLQAVVGCRKDLSGELILSAYVVHRRDTQLSFTAMRQFLALTLLSAMIPSELLGVPDIPLTLSGKVDREALSRLPRPVMHTGGEPVPDDPVEAEVLAIWRDVFGEPAMSGDDDFFESGGHSLLAVILCQRMHLRFRVPFALAVLYAAPTARLMANCIRDQLVSSAVPGSVILIQSGSGEKLLRALLLQVLYTIRSERLLMEQLAYNLLFRWFTGLNMDEEVWVPTVFSKNRDRLLEGDVARAFFEGVLGEARTAGLLSDEHFSVDGTLIEAWASQKSFRPKDETGSPPDDDPGNPTVNFHGEKRGNATHESVTDPDARLARKSGGHEAKLAYCGNVLIATFLCAGLRCGRSNVASFG